MNVDKHVIHTARISEEVATQFGRSLAEFRILIALRRYEAASVAMFEAIQYSPYPEITPFLQSWYDFALAMDSWEARVVKRRGLARLTPLPEKPHAPAPLGGVLTPK